MQEKIKILKIRFDKVTLKEATNMAIEWGKDSKKRYITTPNPEILLEAQKNRKFLKILNRSALNIPDGTGILWASKYLKITRKTNSKIIKIIKLLFSLAMILVYPRYIRTVLPERVTGTDLMQKICEKTSKEKLKIFLLGARKGIAQITKEKLEKKHKGIKITGTYAGTPKPKDEKKIRERINKSGAELLFVAYGAPKQEIWIARNLKRLKTVKVAVGVGGAFNFIAGRKKRAPKLIQKLGLEWAIRLIQQPSRIKRIYNATIKFPLKIINTGL